MIPLSRSLLVAASFAAALCLAAPVSAQGQVSVLYDSFDYRLVDLTPGDGIDPAISFYSSTLTASAFSYDSPYGLGTPRTAITNTADVNMAFTSQDSGSSLSASLTATSGNAHLFVEHGSANVIMSSLGRFTLAPNTQITFEVRGILNELNGTGTGTDSSANLTVIGRLYPDGNMTEYTNSFSTDAGDVYGVLSLGLSSGAEEVYGTLEYRSQLWAHVTPVPEPATTAMLIGGLGLVGALARRRGRRAALAASLV